MILFARYALILPAILVMAFYAPQLFDAALGERITKTHLFYSPVIKKFVWLERLNDPLDKALDDAHHARYVQMDQDGRRYSRREFEKLLPFIYYRNMEVWGLLPLHLDGRVFDKETIKSFRQVLELKPRQIQGRALGDRVHPLLESVPGAARLVFPEDRFRLNDELQFINADYNRRDQEATRKFTAALKEVGFEFPGRLVAGKATVLKPFDEGVFLVDAGGSVFHLKRVKGAPWVVRTPIAPQAGVRSIKVSENRRREFYGLVLTDDGRLHLMTYDDYRLITLPLPDYDPDTMDFKLIINPLYRTAIYSDHATIRAVVMDQNYQPLDTYKHTMPGATLSLAQKVFRGLTPFQLSLEDPTREPLAIVLDWHGWRGTASLALGLLLFGLLAWRRRSRGASLVLDGLLVALSGLYGLAAVAILPPPKD